MKGHYLGLLFASASAKSEFNKIMLNVVKKRLSQYSVRELEKEAAKMATHRFESEIAKEIDLSLILGGGDEEDMELRARELRKILILAGFDVDVDLADQDTMNLITDVLQNFEKESSFKTDEAIFSAKLLQFERHEVRRDSNRNRRKIVKHVNKRRVAEREARADKRYNEKQKKEANTNELQSWID